VVAGGHTLLLLRDWGGRVSVVRMPVLPMFSVWALGLNEIGNE
jgi:hypothetical protein